MLVANGAEWLHVDVMVSSMHSFQTSNPITKNPPQERTVSYMALQDGSFVPNLTIGAPVVKSLRKCTDAFLDCHLMVSNPRKWVQVSM